MLRRSILRPGRPLRRTPLFRGTKPLRRRTPLKATARLEQRAPLRRYTRLKAINPERRAKLYAEQFGAEAELIRQLPCVACGQDAPSDPHHVQTRGAGGKRDALVPLCPSEPRIGVEGCHQELHRVGRRTFELRHQIDLARVAAVIRNHPVTAAVIAGKPHEVVELWRRLAAAEVPS